MGETCADDKNHGTYGRSNISNKRLQGRGFRAAIRQQRFLSWGAVLLRQRLCCQVHTAAAAEGRTLASEDVPL